MTGKSAENNYIWEQKPWFPTCDFWARDVQQDGLWFYPIDNSLSGARSPDPVVAELRHAIEVVAKEDPEEYLERPIPIRPWELTVFWGREEGRDS